MRIGSDYPKIEFEFLNLQLLEPVALISNTLMAAAAIYFWFQLKNQAANPYLSLWKWFFLIFGIGSFFGGLSHIFYNYWGLTGKIAPWGLTIISIAFAELGILKAVDNKKFVFRLKIVIFIKLILMFLLTFTLWNFLIVTANTIIGLLFIVLPLSIQLQKKKSNDFRFFWLGVVALLPAAAVYLLKINLHLWVNKDDLSHLFIIGCILFFFIGVKKTAEIKTRNLIKIC